MFFSFPWLEPVQVLVVMQSSPIMTLVLWMGGSLKPRNRWVETGAGGLGMTARYGPPPTKPVISGVSYVWVPYKSYEGLWIPRKSVSRLAPTRLYTVSGVFCTPISWVITPFITDQFLGPPCVNIFFSFSFLG